MPLRLSISLSSNVKFDFILNKLITKDNYNAINKIVFHNNK